MATLSSDLAVSLVGQGWAAAVGLAFIPFYVAHLGIDGYALIALLPLLTAMCLVLDGGLALTLNREMARLRTGEPAHVREVAAIIVVAHLLIGTLAGSALIALLPTLGAQWLQHDGTAAPALHKNLLLMAVTLVLQWPVPLLQNGLIGLGKQAFVNLSLATHATVLNVGAATLIVLHDPATETYLAWASACAVAHAIGLGLAFQRWLPAAPGPLKLRVSLLRQVAAFSGGAAGIGFAGVLLTHLDRLIASRLLTLEQFGYYSIAATVGRTVYLLIAPVHSAVFPRLTALVSSRDQVALEHAYSLGTQMMCVAVFPLAAVIVWMDSDLALAWLGDPRTAASVAGVAGIIAAGSALNGLMHLPFALQLAHGHTKPALLISMGLLAGALPTAYALFSLLGPIGLAATWLLLNVVYALVGAPLTQAIVGRGSVLQWVRNDVAGPLAAAFSSVGVAHALLGDATARGGSAIDVLIGLAVGFVFTILAAPRVRTSMLAIARVRRDRAP